MKKAAQALRTGGTASFRVGVAWHRPNLAQEGVTGAGIFDCESRETRLVRTAMSPFELDYLRAHQTRRLRSRLAMRMFEWVNGPVEGCFGREHALVRDGRDGEWMDVMVPGDDGPRRLDIDPAWLIELLDAPEEAVLERRERPLIDGGVHVRARLDLDLARPLLPMQLARETAADAPARRARFECATGPGGLPAWIAFSAGPLDGTNTRLWRLVEFTSFGEPFDEVDLWTRWHEETGRAVSETTA